MKFWQNYDLITSNAYSEFPVREDEYETGTITFLPGSGRPTLVTEFF
ncbi:hypothetical protein D1AOALGA4SA_6048 [Olavius algarvensis Delta 1 endosymbiont]|nr:hypothetical protein D1AOALGA4SA_6048 [Olavius algarvensis Delta 1 endosymbiont]